MFYDDFRRLQQIHSEVLEDSSSEVATSLLMEICTLTLRLTSRWLSAEHSYVWSRAKSKWETSGQFLNWIQNRIYGTSFEVYERIEHFQVCFLPFNHFLTSLKLTLDFFRK